MDESEPLHKEFSIKKIIKEMKKSVSPSHDMLSGDSKLNGKDAELRSSLIKSIQKEMDTLHNSVTSLLISLEQETSDNILTYKQWSTTSTLKENQQSSCENMVLNDDLSDQANSILPVKCVNSNSIDLKEKLRSFIPKMVNFTANETGANPVKEIDTCIKEIEISNKESTDSNALPRKESFHDLKEKAMNAPSSKESFHNLKENVTNAWSSSESFYNLKEKAMNALRSKASINNLKETAMSYLPDKGSLSNFKEKAMGSLPDKQTFCDVKDKSWKLFPDQTTVQDLKQWTLNALPRDQTQRSKSEAEEVLKDMQQKAKSAEEALKDIQQKAKSALCDIKSVEDGSYQDKPVNFLHHQLRGIFCKENESGGSVQGKTEDDSSCDATKKS